MMPATLPLNPPVVEFVYVGGPTAILKINGFKIVTDPTFDPPGNEYASGTVHLKKEMGPAVSANQVGHVDLVLLSHDQHPDNLDTEGRKLLKTSNRVFTTVSGASRLGFGVGMKTWDTREIALPGGLHLRVTATPARHGPAGIEKVVGEVTGFLLTIVETQQDLFYVTGDTVWFDGLARLSEKAKPKYIVLFAGAAQTRGPFHLTMDVNDAFEVAAAFPQSTLIPVHYEGWAHFTQSAQDIEKAFHALGVNNRLLIPGAGKEIRLDHPN